MFERFGFQSSPVRFKAVSHGSASSAALWFGRRPRHTFSFAAAARLHHGDGVLDLGAVGAGQLHLLLTGGGFSATLALVHHRVSCCRIYGRASTVSSAGRHVDRLWALAALHLDDCLLALDLTDTPHLACFAASVSISCLGARFTVQGVKCWTLGCDFLGNELSIDILTCVLHTLVVGGNIRAALLNDHRFIVRCGENTARLDTLPTALARFGLIFITFGACCLADNRFAVDDVHASVWIHFGATVTHLAGPRFELFLCYGP